METIGRIRREHFIKGKTIREIARDLKVSRNTVRKILRSGETAFEYERNVQPRPKLGRWTAELDDLLSGNAAKPAGSSRNFAGAVTRAATTLCAVTPGAGPSSMGKRRLQPMSH